MLRDLFKNSFIYLIPTFISRGLSIFLVPFYTSFLSTADYGSLDLINTFGNFISMLITLEISQGLARYLIEENNEKKKIIYSSSSIFFALFIYLLFLIITLICSSQFSIFIIGRSGLEITYRLGILSIILNGLFYLIQNQLRWEFRSKEYSFSSSLLAITTAINSIILCYFFEFGLNGILTSNIIGTLISLIYCTYHLRNSYIFTFSLSYLRRMLSFSIPLVFSSAAVWISLYSDRIMINNFLSLDLLGIYGVGYRFSAIAILLISGFQLAFTPQIYKNYKSPKTPKKLSFVFKIFSLLAILLYLFMTLGANYLFPIFISPNFISSKEIIIILLPAVLFSRLYIFAPGMEIRKKTNLILLVNIISASSNLILNFALIPLLNIKGAALATLISSIIHFNLYIFISQKYYRIPYNWAPSLKALVIAITLIFVTLLSEEPYKFILTLISIPLYFYLILKFNLFDKSEIKYIVRSMKNIKN